MSSIRLFILGSLDERGPMHGHQLRLLAEEEHVDQWTDVSVGALYGAMKRLAADDLIVEERVERTGNYPERQVYAISDAGRAALARLRNEGLEHVVLRPDPFDLAMTRLDPAGLDDLEATVVDRLATLRAMLDRAEHAAGRADPFLTVSERIVMTHKHHRLRAEITWHESLLARVPDIIADERSRRSPTLEGSR